MDDAIHYALEVLKGVAKASTKVCNTDYEFILNEDTLEAFREIEEKKKNGTLKRYKGTVRQVFALLDEEDLDE